MKETKDEEDKQKRMIEDERKRQMQELKAQGAGTENVIMPKYQMDKKLNVYREHGMPPASLFVPLGWDENPESKAKHYRKFYPTELELVKEIMPAPSPFQTFLIKRGQSRGASKSLWPFKKQKTDDSGAVSDEQVVGKFKGIVTVQS